MDIKVLKRQGMSIRHIARTTGLSRQTVRRVLMNKTPQGYGPRPERASKLDPFLPVMEALHQERPQAPASWLYRQICQEGYGGCYELVKVRLRHWRREEKARRSACVRFETGPGVEGQFDWKGPVTGLLENEPQKKIWFFRFLLGYSRWWMTIVVTSTRLAAVLTNLRETFEKLGGMTERIVFDNFKAAVVRPRPQLILQPLFAEFCRHYGTEPWPALPRRPQRKGKVERSYRDLIDAGLLEKTYSSLAALQAAVTAEDEAHAQRIISTTGARPEDRLEVERAFLIPLPEVAFDPRLAEIRRVLSDCTISYRGSRYSVPWQLVGSRLTVKADAFDQQLEIFDREQLVATHRLVAKGTASIEEEHISELRRPRWQRSGNYLPAGSTLPQPAPLPLNSLVLWPAVSVEIRPIETYAALIEGGAR